MVRSRSMLLLVCLMATGCGTSKSTSSIQPERGEGRAGQTPAAIIRQMAAALHHVRSYHLEGRVGGSQGSGRIAADVDGDGDVRLRMTTGRRSTVDAVVVGSAAFLRATTAYWLDHGGPVAASRLRGRWVTVPTHASNELIRAVKEFAPQRLAACTRPTPRLEYGGTTTVGGRAAVIIVDRGSPGDAPGAAYIRLKGPALPLRIVQSGPPRPGKARNAKCAPARGQFATEDVRLSRFNADIKVEPPANPLSLG